MTHKQFMERARRKMFPLVFVKPLDVARYFENYASRRAGK